MKLSESQATLLLKYLLTKPAQELADAGLFSVMVALMKPTPPPEEGRVFINVPEMPNSLKIESIKAIRCLTRMGLKEAKEAIENLNPYNKSGEFGPIVTFPTKKKAIAFVGEMEEAFAENGIRHITLKVK